MKMNRSRDERNTRLQIVPWYNKKEWEETYHQAYSDNVELQEKAHSQMIIWKARMPCLPMGVECTLSMLHVQLCDKQTGHQDRELQLLYSTAVMRFLNHLSTMSGGSNTMYKVAERHGLPDWLINLRHQAAHGNTVPALYLLRQAGDIIMQWLRENYWEVEMAVMTDVVKDLEKERAVTAERIMEQLELWLALKMSHWAGCKTIDRLEDADVRAKAMKLAEEVGTGIKLPDKEVKISPGKMKKGDTSVVENPAVEDEAETKVYTHKIKSVFVPLGRKLFEPLKSKGYQKTRYRKCFVDCLIKYEAFCPQIDLEQLDESEVLQLMSLLGELWKELLETLHSQRQLHWLLAGLVSAQAQQPLAQLWLRLLTQLLAGDDPPHPPANEQLCRELASCLPCQVQPEVLMHKVNKHHAKHQRPLQLRCAYAEEIDVLQDLAKSVLHNPSKFTTRYLSSLLGFWEKPMTEDTREQLCTLAEVFTGCRPCDERATQVYTLASLLDHGLVIDQPDESTEQPPPPDTSPWQLYTGDADWSKCALGVLPKELLLKPEDDAVSV